MCVANAIAVYYALSSFSTLHAHKHARTRTKHYKSCEKKRPMNQPTKSVVMMMMILDECKSVSIVFRRVSNKCRNRVLR